MHGALSDGMARAQLRYPMREREMREGEKYNR